MVLLKRRNHVSVAGQHPHWILCEINQMKKNFEDNFVENERLPVLLTLIGTEAYKILRDV